MGGHRQQPHRGDLAGTVGVADGDARGTLVSLLAASAGDTLAESDVVSAVDLWRLAHQTRVYVAVALAHAHEVMREVRRRAPHATVITVLDPLCQVTENELHRLIERSDEVVVVGRGAYRRGVARMDAAHRGVREASLFGRAIDPVGAPPSAGTDIVAVLAARKATSAHQHDSVLDVAIDAAKLDPTRDVVVTTGGMRGITSDRQSAPPWQQVASRGGLPQNLRFSDEPVRELAFGAEGVVAESLLDAVMACAIGVPALVLVADGRPVDATLLASGLAGTEDAVFGRRFRFAQVEWALEHGWSAPDEPALNGRGGLVGHGANG